MNISLNVLSKKINLIGLLFFTIILSAQVQEKEYSNFKPTAITSFGTAPISIFDSEASIPNQNNLGTYCYLSLNIDNNLAPFVTYELKATFRITPLKQDGTSDASFDKELVVNYNPNPANSGGANFNDLSYLKIENRFGIRVQLISYKALNTSAANVVPNNAFVNMGFKTRRYYSVSEQLLNPIGSTNAEASSVTINWGTLAGALEYELEWTWIDNYSNESITAHLAGDQIPFTDRDFELNNTRIITSKNTFEIPLIYGKGYLIYRVRGISRNTEFVKYYGNWSSGTSPKATVADWPHQSVISEHEAGKNWQFQASYAEDGKKKEIVSYFDGSLRNRQTVTKINTDNTTIVGEVIYDAQGRPAVEVLPTPNKDTNIHYFKDYNLNNQSKLFSYKDFDVDGGSCASVISGMSEASGSSRYYSPSGYADFSLRTNQAYVPDARLYPFSQIEYTPDNTGRISRKGGVGEDHQLGTGHEMKYFYTTPTASELHRLFGYSVGESSHYKKNIVIDPNKQVSVSYLDPQGRTIATALSGKSPANLDGLADENTDTKEKADQNGHGITTADLLNKITPADADTPKDNNISQSSGVFPLSNDMLTLSKSIEVTNDGEGYEFEYSLDQTSSFSPFYCPTGLYPFVYDVKLGLKDNCGNEKLDAPILTSVGTFNLSGSNIPATLSAVKSKATLDTGSYSLKKEIKVNEKALLEYADNYIKKLTTPNSGCYIDPADPKFGLAPSTEFIYDSCSITCQSCIDSIGTKLNYVQNAFDKLYGKVVVTVSKTGSTISISLITGSTDFDGNLIQLSDVNALNVRFSREWELLNKECNTVCNPTLIEFETACQMNENLLVSDLRPNGQYGATDATIIDVNGAEVLDTNGNPVPNPNFDKLSIFNSNGSLFYNGDTTQNDWKHPITPYKIDGVLSLIRVEVIDKTKTPFTCNPKVDTNPVLSAVKNPDGSDIWEVKPEQLSKVKDFILNWDDSWAQSLLPYHPEYKYLEYSSEICKRTIDFYILKNEGTVPTTAKTPLSSDGYDSYMMNITTYKEANDKGLVDFDSAGNSGKLQIYSNDPYFKPLQSSSPFEDSTLYNMRVGTGSIMYQAINSSYIGESGNNLTMYQAALKGVFCNSFSICDVNNITFSNDIQKDEVWNAYKALYIGLKSKIKHIFINIYAMKSKSFNGCIGTNGSNSITDVLSNNFPQKNILSNYIQNNISTSGSLCESTSALLYQAKQKNFLPADFGYNSGLNPADAVANLVKANHFEYYAQTGNCPLLFDFEMLLNGFFKDPAFTSSISVIDKPFNKQYITKELIKKLMIPAINQTVEGLFQAGLQPLKITTPKVSGSILNMNFTPQTGGGFTTCPIVIELPETGGYTWSNYGSTWKIKNLKQLYYDLGNSDPVNKKYKFSAVAQIGPIGNNTISNEVILTGETCAPIGECGISPNAIGEVLDPNQATNDQGVGCNKKSKFENALIPLFNELKTKGTFNSNTPVDITNYAAYTNSYLKEFFGNAAGITWERNAQNLYIKQGTNIIASIVLQSTTGAGGGNHTAPVIVLMDSYTFRKFDSVTFETANTDSTIPFKLVISGNTNFTTGTAILNGTLKLFNTNFDCCPIASIQDSDHDGVADDLDNCPNTPNTDQLDINLDGIGDACQEVIGCVTTPNINACVNTSDEIAFEKGLKNVINHILSDPASYDEYGNLLVPYRICKDFPLMKDFIANSHLTEHFQALKDRDDSSSCNDKSDVNLYQFQLGKDVDDSISIYFYDENEEQQGGFRLGVRYLITENGEYEKSVFFNKIDIDPEGTISTNYDSKTIKCFDVKVDYKYVIINDLSCYSLTYDFCDFLAPLLPTDTIACELNAQEEIKYEDNFRDVINEAIQNNTVSYVYNMSGTRYDSASSPAMRNFLSDSNLLSRFQKLRDYIGTSSTTYNLQIDLSKFTVFFPNDWQIALQFSSNENTAWEASIYFDIPNNKNISSINKIDITNKNVGRISYLDVNGIMHENEISSIKQSVSLSLNSSQGTDICTFVNENYPNKNTARIAQNTSILGPVVTMDASGVFTNSNISTNSTSKNTSRIAASSITESCSICIPQTVAPVACDEKKAAFISAMNKKIPDYSVPQSTLDNFCNNGYQYISDSYIRYLNELKVEELYDIRFRTLAEFGDTYLHYGFNGINTVIEQYKKYYNENLVNNVLNPDTLNWNDWVETKFKVDNKGKFCPPAALSSLVSPDLPEEKESTCEKLVKNIAEAFSADNYNNLLQEKRKEFMASYIKKAMSEVVETLDMTYYDQEYQYTLYYYDQAGNLTQTVAPEGVKRFLPAEIKAKNALIEAHKVAEDPLSTFTGDVGNLQPNHELKTQYRYNSLNQLVWQSTPDGGITRFAYDKLGRIIASQNAKQLTSTIAKMSYTSYDVLGRINQAGEIDSFVFNAANPSAPVSYSISAEGRLLRTPVPSGATTGIVDSFESNLSKRQVTSTIYDDDPEVETGIKASSLFTTNAVSGFNPAYNNRNRVTGIFYHENYTNPKVFDNAILYNYDVHGNVKEIVNYYTPLKNPNCTQTVINTTTGQKNDCEVHLKRIVYQYDLISGNVNAVKFQPNKPDQYTHRYNYDADNRIVDVETSANGVLWEKDASYQYYPHGPLARVELGDKKVQGVDYAYTLQGWLKTVNGENLANSENDLGQDGSLAGTTKTKDAFGYSLNYYENDYKAISGDTGTDAFRPLMVSRNTTGATLKNLYNGNIKQMTTAIRKNGDQLLAIQKNNYTYDQLNRIKTMTSQAFDAFTMQAVKSYESSYSYDKNGNLQTLRNTAPGLYPNSKTPALPNPEMDNFIYKYIPGTNKLTNVFDVADDIFTETGIDIKQNLTEKEAYRLGDADTYNYVYDAIGQLIKDKNEGLTIEWRVDGKVEKVTNSKSGVIINFEYDGLGNRIAKRVQRGTDIVRTHYARDAQGNVLAVYDENYKANGQGNSNESLYRLKEHHLFGSSRLGLEATELLIYKYMNNSSTYKTAQNLLAKNSSMLAKASILTGTTVIRNYALHFDTNTPTAEWMMQAGNLPVLNPELTSLNLDTNIKLANLNLSNGTYFLGQLQYKGDKEETENTTENVVLTGINNNCLMLTPVSGTFTVTRRNSSTCPLGNEVTLFETNEEGTLEYKTSNLNSSNNVSVGFKINNKFYGFKTTTRRIISSLRGTLQYSDGTNYINITTSLSNNSSVQTLKLEKTLNPNGVGCYIEFFRNGISVAKIPVANRAVATSNIDIVPSAGRITDLKVTKKVVKKITKEITNQVQIVLIKENNGIRPKVTVNQYTKTTSNTPATATSRSYEVTMPANRALTNAQAANGIALNLNTTFAAGTVFSVNGSTLYKDEKLWSTPLNINPAAVPAVGNNQLGGTGTARALGFDMCYFNYGINNIQNAFSFDDATNETITNNPPVSSQGIVMNNDVTRTLGPCLPDTDGDGLFDLYEVNNDLTFIDTDGDGIANHDDKDDDGDGIYTMYEGADPDGDHNPATGTAPLNTNALLSALNPKAITNSIPNYLDIDDDGDGYATWETYEGGKGIINATTSGTPYTLNTDNPNDAIPNYLDPTNGLYTPTLPIAVNNFISLTGDKRYELSNHLGNVLSVISDKKIPSLSSGSLAYFNAEVLNYSDYYPFGQLVPNRHGSSDSYRYGFNGMEKDDELKGEGNSMNYTFRMYDPRVGRFFSTDPLTKEYPMLTPYQFASNTPIAADDLEGLEARVRIKKNTYFVTLKNVNFKFVFRKSTEYFTEAAARNNTPKKDFTINTQMFDYKDKWDYFNADTPQPSKDYTPQGLNIIEGAKTSGRSSENTFYFSQSSSGEWTTGFGDVPSDSKFGFGGGTPLVVDGLKFGETNIYKDNAPENVTKIGIIGRVDPKNWKYLKQKSNGVYSGQNESDVGKTILGYNSKTKNWIIVSQQNGEEGFTLNQIRDYLYSKGFDNVLGFDGSTSSTLSVDGNTKVSPDERKNSTIPTGLNISVPQN
nr:RHS repeat-associated core domain-containing protein [uncultured Flavobacterium sp.]